MIDKYRTQYIHLEELNLSIIGNLIIAKTFLISKLGYLLSMMDCQQEILTDIEDDIYSFIMITKHPTGPQNFDINLK